MFVKELEITLENGMKISGELDLPERQGQWKTIILFHGSGPSDRHATVESMGGIVSRNFDLLSEGFVKARYAVFRYDKRENYDIEIIIRDAREVTRFVSGLSEVEGILFYGWSEGVRVCTTLVSDFPNAQALILQSGIAEGWSSYFSYILRELTVEKLKELDNNSDSILEISDFLNCIPDSTSISFSLYLLILGKASELLGENIIINRIFLINPSKAKESDLYLGDISIIDGNSVAIKSWEKAVLGNVREFESNSNDIFDIIMRELENDK